MEKKINLIPAEMSVPPKTVKFTKIINKISTIGTISLIVVVVLAISLFVYFNLEQRKVNASIDSLKTRISGLEQSEQQLVLTKDRLGRIAIIKLLPSIREDLSNFQDVASLISGIPDTSLLEANIQTNKTEFSVNSKNSNSLALLLEPMTRLSKYKSIILTSLGFSQAAGYVSDLVTGK